MHVRVRERLRVELGEMRSDWNRWCERRNLTPAEGVRKLITEALGVGVVDTRAEAEVQWNTIGAPCARIEVKLTPAEREVLEHRAAMLGQTRNRWIVALIRAQLRREPQLGLQEARLLSDSNQQLAVISQRLGQIAREGHGASIGSNGDSDIAAVREHIDVHLRAVAAVIRANLDRWSR
jgi:uncharacterized protein (DUF1778 family)